MRKACQHGRLHIWLHGIMVSLIWWLCQLEVLGGLRGSKITQATCNATSRVQETGISWNCLNSGSLYSFVAPMEAISSEVCWHMIQRTSKHLTRTNLAQWGEADCSCTARPFQTSYKPFPRVSCKHSVLVWGPSTLPLINREYLICGENMMRLIWLVLFR